MKELNQRVLKSEVKWIFLFKDKDIKDKWAYELMQEVNRIRNTYNISNTKFIKIENKYLSGSKISSSPLKATQNPSPNLAQDSIKDNTNSVDTDLNGSTNNYNAGNANQRSSSGQNINFSSTARPNQPIEIQLASKRPNQSNASQVQMDKFDDSEQQQSTQPLQPAGKKSSANSNQEIEMMMRKSKQQFEDQINLNSDLAESIKLEHQPAGQQANRTQSNPNLQ